MTINCTINWNNNKSCTGTDYFWKNENDIIKCPDSSSTTYFCDWDHINYIFLNISDVQKEENFTVGIRAPCGLDDQLVILQIVCE